MRRERVYRLATVLGIVAVMVISNISYAATGSPKLIINIVAGTMRADDLERYEANFCDGGFKRLMSNGVVFTDAEYDYMLTTSPTALATIATGAQPSVHGVIGDSWWNYIDSSEVNLIADDKAQSVPYSTGSGNYSPARLTAHTVGDMLLAANRESKQFSIAVDALSAITINGKSGIALWCETKQTHWTTSSYYRSSLPQWISEYNRHDSNRFYAQRRWTPYYVSSLYINSEVAIMKEIRAKTTRQIIGIDSNIADDAIGVMRYTPAGNSMVLNFARNVISFEGLGADENPDILNICLDTSRYIAMTYGPESIEYEDMIYRLDVELEKFLKAVYAELPPADVVVTFSSCHGTSPSHNPVGAPERERFNTRQMEVIVNAFLGARYGSNNYILGFKNNAIYLNHEVILAKRLPLETIREEVAVFVLQLRGVASAYSATALRYTSFAEGRSRLAQQSFYAARSGDVLIDLMPGWTIEDNSYRSTSHSGYGYEVRVPLIICGGDIAPKQVERRVNMTELAPTISDILNIETPWASSERAIKEIRSR